ncbi:hypothetical protein BKA82DRAFT_28547 [Pisolithus tinctorius]|uniref:Uncharacterized protein n=1 Tax=Pisolithus tinctorius Marx 270 TaxID=870435 RepID=A0A0C3P2H2_PISTI|nr:hypothetical protein BKA82DRAFT_28547 [Pisolithus tinctorius]KIO01504.1 hypothetical protein M404DRAFT_28547 [Pisolithus tinctorius Marx 270]
MDEPHLLTPSAIGANANLVSKGRLAMMPWKMVDVVVTASDDIEKGAEYYHEEIGDLRVAQRKSWDDVLSVDDA